MHYIVLDLEWNIAGNANKVEKATQEAIPFEIIEIGAVKLDECFQMVSKFSVCIRPQIYPILSGHVAAVTRRLQQSLKYGLHFKDAARDFLKWCGEDYMFCTWSESDVSVLRSNLKFHGLAGDLQAECLDVQYVFDELIEQADIQRSIEYALDFLRLPKDQPFHQAVSDAWYTGLILQKIAGISREEQASTRFIQRYSFNPNLNRACQMTLDGHLSIPAALTALQELAMTCPACGLALDQQLAWKLEGSKALATFNCPDHGRIRGKTRFRSRSDSQVQAKVAIRIDRDQEG